MEYKLELAEAIESGDFEEFSQLFEPSDLDCDEYDGTLLHAAARFGTVQIVKFLVRNGANVNCEGGRSKALPVTLAAQNGNLEILKYLVEEAGSTIDATRPLSNPLLRASARGAIGVVEYLLIAGIDPHLTYRVPTGKLINAYEQAKAHGHKEIMELLEHQGCRSPTEGQDKLEWEPSEERMMNHTGRRQRESPRYKKHQQIIRYMEERFGTVDQDEMQELVPVIEGMSVGINVIPPNEKHPYLVLFTNGMSDLSMTVPEGQEDWCYAELVIHLPPDWVHPRQAASNPRWLWPIKWLRTLAYQPVLNESWLGVPAAIVSGSEPLGPNTEQSCFLIMPGLSNLNPPLQLDDRKKIHFFTMVPIYTEERDIELRHGMNEFFRRFHENEVSLTVDVERANFGLG